MKRMIGCVIGSVALIAMVAVSEGFAEARGDKGGSYGLEQITVSDKRGAREPVTSPYAVPESSGLQTEVITREEIEVIQPKTIYDILEYVPGMEIEFQGRRQLNFMNMRGQGSYGVIIDGVYIPSLQFNSRILATIPVDIIESVIVVRDATALTLGPFTNFGSDNGSSNQGFIVVKTRKALQLEGGFVAGYGSLRTQKEHVYQGARINDFDYRVAYTHQETQGETNWYNGSRNNSFYLRGGYTGRAITADMFYYDSRGMRELQRGEKLDGTLDLAKWKYDPLLSSMVAFSLSKPWNSSQTTTFRYGHGIMENDWVSAYFPPGKQTVTITGESDWAQTLDLRHVAVFDHNTLRLGGQLLSWRTSQDMYSLYVYDEYRLFQERLSLDGGIRMDKKYYRESPVTGNDMHEWSKEVYSFAGGAAYRLNRQLTVTGRLAYSENTLAGYQVDSVARASLAPERQYRYEAGILGNLHPAFNPSVTFFFYDVENQKVGASGLDPVTGKTVSSYIDPVTGDEVDYVTTQDVRSKGVEFSVYGSLFRHFSYNINYSYITTDNRTTNRRRPHYTASGRLGYRYKTLGINLLARHVGPYSQITASPGAFNYDFGDYTRVDANITYDFKIFDRDTRIKIYGQNLGDDHYTTRYVTGAYKDVGRVVGVELAYSFF